MSLVRHRLRDALPPPFPAPAPAAFFCVLFPLICFPFIQPFPSFACSIPCLSQTCCMESHCAAWKAIAIVFDVMKLRKTANPTLQLLQLLTERALRDCSMSKSLWHSLLKILSISGDVERALGCGTSKNSTLFVKWLILASQNSHCSLNSAVFPRSPHTRPHTHTYAESRNRTTFLARSEQNPIWKCTKPHVFFSS